MFSGSHELAGEPRASGATRGPTSAESASPSWSRVRIGALRAAQPSQPRSLRRVFPMPLVCSTQSTRDTEANGRETKRIAPSLHFHHYRDSHASESSFVWPSLLSATFCPKKYL